MNNLGYFLAKVRYRICGCNKEIINNFFRKYGIKIGRGCNICCNILTPESFLIEIGDNVTIGDQVDFVTHDNSINKVSKEAINLFGKIIIGNNCFIGERSTLMYGVTLADNIIVASGSVVVDSFSTERIIIGGNPARVISSWDSFYEKSKSKALGKNNIQKVLEENPSFLVKRESRG